jgi:hypothetical protein
MRFVVTGTGRCGTSYTSSLFNAAGVPCGHEDIFNVRAGVRDIRVSFGLRADLLSPVLRLREEWRRRFTRLEGDASWMAVPRLRWFNGTKFLQLRHPMRVVQSWVAVGFFSFSPALHLQARWASQYMTFSGDDLTDAMRWWVLWNDLAAQKADFTYRLEDLDSDLFAQMLETIDVDDPRGRAERALASTPRYVNSAEQRGEERVDLSWDEIPDSRAKAALAEAAARFGYKLDADEQ